MGKKQPKPKDLFGINVVVSPHVGDDKIVLVGKEEWKDSLHFVRRLSVWDLKTGVISGNCYEGEVQVIHVSERNKDYMSKLAARPQITEEEV